MAGGAPLGRRTPKPVSNRPQPARTPKTFTDVLSRYTNRAFAWWGMGLFDLAIADLDEVIRLDARNIGAIDLPRRRLRAQGRVRKSFGRR